MKHIYIYAYVWVGVFEYIFKKYHNTNTCIVHVHFAYYMCAFEYGCMPNGILCQSYKNKSVYSLLAAFIWFILVAAVEKKWKKSDYNRSYSGWSRKCSGGMGEFEEGETGDVKER